MGGQFHLLQSDGSGCTFHADNTLRAAIDQEQGEGQIMLIWSGEPSLGDLRQVSEEVYDLAMQKSTPPALTVEMGGHTVALNPDAARGRPVKGGNIILAVKNVHNMIRLKAALDDLYRKMELKAKWTIDIDRARSMGYGATLVTCWECEAVTPYTPDGRCERCRV